MTSAEQPEDADSPAEAASEESPVITGSALAPPDPTADRAVQINGQQVATSDGQPGPIPPEDTVEVAAATRPPWQRTTSEIRYAPPKKAPGAAQSPAAVEGWVYTPAASGGVTGQPGTATTSGFQAEAGPDDLGSRTTVNVGMAAAAGRGFMPGPTPTALRRPGRGPRRASLQVKRVDPWSVLKLSFALSVALFFVWLVAVGVLYGVLDGMGVWDKLNGTYSEFAQNTSAGGSGPLITAGRVFGIAAIIGAINIVLFTALTTVGAFVYNISSDIAGGLEMTLAERE